jgi:hypothetical protein
MKEIDVAVQTSISKHHSDQAGYNFFDSDKKRSQISSIPAWIDIEMINQGKDAVHG